jgi:hypothetical protein
VKRPTTLEQFYAVVDGRASGRMEDLLSEDFEFNRDGRIHGDKRDYLTMRATYERQHGALPAHALERCIALGGFELLFGRVPALGNERFVMAAQVESERIRRLLSFHLVGGELRQKDRLVG